MLHLELTYTVRYDRMGKYMLLESLETLPFIIVTVINLLSVIKAIYRLLNHKRILIAQMILPSDFMYIPMFFMVHASRQSKRFVENRHGSIGNIYTYFTVNGYFCAAKCYRTV